MAKGHTTRSKSSRTVQSSTNKTRSKRTGATVSSGNRERLRKADPSMIIVISVLIIFSMIVTYSISPALAQQAGVSEAWIISRQFMNIGVSVLAFFICSRIDTGIWRKLQGLLAGVTLLSFIALLIPGIGQEVLGATRWISIGPFTFQPVELAKFTSCLYLASFLAKRSETSKINDRSYTLWPVLAVLFTIGAFVVIAQKDLGSMIVLVGMGLTMLFIAGLRFRDMLAAVSIFGVATAVAAFTAQHRVVRLAAFFNPEQQSEETLYHISQALIAVGSGGIFGKGLGKSVQVYGYLPQAANDSVFAILAEKVGFVGTVGILGLYGYLIFRMVKVIDLNENTFEKVFTTGVMTWLFAHVAINIGAMLELIPITGITLPFVSFGGTSIVFLMAALGVVYRASRNVKYENSGSYR